MPLNLYKFTAREMGRPLSEAERVTVNLQKRMLHRLSTAKKRLEKNGTISQARINAIIGELRKNIVPQLAKQLPFRADISSFKNIIISNNDNGWNGFCAKEVIEKAIETAQAGRFGEARCILSNIKPWDHSVEKPKWFEDNIYGYIKRLESQIEQVLIEVRKCLRGNSPNSIKAAKIAIDGLPAKIPVDRQKLFAILQNEITRGASTQSTLEEIEKSLKQGDPLAAAVRLREHYTEIGLVAYHGIATFSFEQASQIAVERYEKRKNSGGAIKNSQS